ncbi:sugar nucleotide-binding protein [Kocuria oceani]|uniref:dTDP-4-dehydrorhamnose reductase n=1 Tax=Kocuria oceani TaxID=988827 RepID=A0ABV9TFK1_9MICC|nr:sugar nucleotide-binding protein [Kocuria oceani]
MSSSEPAVRGTAIPGLLLVDLPVHGDDRGWFKENWQRTKAVAAGVPDFGPVQNNISFNGGRGTTRGIHAEPWDKYVSVATGRVFGAWVDLRGGDTFGTVVTCEIDPATAVFVPRGVGNAFQTLDDATAYTYLVNDHWSGDALDEYSFLNLADETVGIDWPVPLEQAQLSEKDRRHPRLSEVVPLPPAPVLVVGRTGQLGRALVELLERRGLPHRAVDRAELDLADPDGWPEGLRTGEHLRRYRAVLNAAAHTAVDDAETPDGRTAAWAANATGVAALAGACAAAGVPLLHVSTDYVFDGTLPHDEAYPVDAPLAPLSVYGQSKAAGEAAVTALPRHWLVRTSWVIGRGHNFVSVMAGLASRGISPRVVDDQVGRLTFVEDLAAGLLHLVDHRAPWGTYHLTGAGEPLSWAAVARHVFERVGADPERVVPVSTAEYVDGRTGVAPRPANSVLDLSALRRTGFEPRDHMELLGTHLHADGATGRPRD